MSKIIILLCAVFAVAKGDINSVGYHSDIGARVDDYINLNRLQHSRVLADYDTKLSHFTNRYTGRIEGLSLLLELLRDSVVQNEEVLNPLEVLSDISKKCVSHYRKPLLDENYVKTRIYLCIAKVSSQIGNLLSNATKIRNDLEDLYKNLFENEVKNCGKKFAHTVANYTRCVTGVAATTNAETIKNQKLFEIELEAAECIAKSNIKAAFDCSYTIQKHAISLMSEADVLIKNCVNRKEECQPCNTLPQCLESYKIDSKTHAIVNPFYQRTDNPSCVVLNLEH